VPTTNLNLTATIAIAFAQAGAKVMVAGRRMTAENAIAQKIQTLGGDAIFVQK